MYQPKGTDKPKVAVALLKKIIEANGVRTYDQWGELIMATGGDEQELTSKARAYMLLAAYYKELMDRDDLPPGAYPAQDPDRWLDYGSPLIEFGWPKDEVPDFVEWVARSIKNSKKPLSTITKDAYPSDLEVEDRRITGEGFGHVNSTLTSDADSDYDKKLSDLFDPVPVTSLEKMFPADGEWKNWTERAKRNGLIIARKAHGKFNPYEAALWFINRGETGWDLARCNRVS